MRVGRGAMIGIQAAAGVTRCYEGSFQLMQIHSFNWCASKCQLHTDAKCLTGHSQCPLVLTGPSLPHNFRSLEQRLHLLFRYLKCQAELLTQLLAQHGMDAALSLLPCAFSFALGSLKESFK